MIRTFAKTVKEVERWFDTSPSVLAFDFETTGLNYLKMEPVGVSFCDGDRSLYIDLWENGEQDEIFQYLYRMFYSGLFIAHNAKFDFKCLTKFVLRPAGLDLPVPDCSNRSVSLFCTYLASFLLDENRQSHSLENLSQYYFGTGKAGKWDQYSDWHSQEFYDYGIIDAELTYGLYELFAPRLKEEGLETVFKIEMDFIPVAAEIEMNGVFIDQEELANLQCTVEMNILSTEDQMLDQVGKKANLQEGLFGQKFRKSPVNFNSSQQLVACLLKLGLPLKEKSDSGAWSVSKTTLDRLKGNEFVDLLATYKQLNKLHSSYILPAWGMIDEDGRIRPNVGIVKTGRTSMSNPNLQQLPNVRDATVNYRKIFSTIGTLIGADYSGQELRILGEITQDERIKYAFANDHDLHLVTANHIFNLGLEEESLINKSAGHTIAKDKYHSERYRAKNGANFPIVYGSTAAGIAWRQGVSREEAQDWVDGFFEAYPKVKTEMATIPNELWKNQEVRTLMGRKRRFPDFKVLPQYAGHKQPSKDRCVRQAFNFKIQGFAADQAKIAGRKIYDQLKKHPEWKAKIILLIHDEFLLEVLNPKYVKEVKECLRNCMENAVSLSVPFKVDIKIGKSYAECK